MKTLLPLALIAASAVALPATAQQVAPGASGAIAHFNQDIDSANAKARIPAIDDSVSASSRAVRIQNVYARFNESTDRANDKIGRNGTVTIVSGEPTHGAGIFAIIDAE